ncbi:MAG: winged helix-turn-helix transcriptional regulator [Treponema sp.]|nr:winged helix-turn-helix transcriptional regulator [Treponema sp.]MBP5576095.1 winged helix-turn-helix transcriptional regulator [Treponema sp.]
MNESEFALVCKALGDENRVQIIKMLTGGELCACKILDAFNITQPTLSHHMKILTDCNLVNSRKEGKWTYYSINCKRFSEFKGAVSEFACKTSAAKKSAGKCCAKE